MQLLRPRCWWRMKNSNLRAAHACRAADDVTASSRFPAPVLHKPCGISPGTISGEPLLMGCGLSKGAGPMNKSPPGRTWRNRTAVSYRFCVSERHTPMSHIGEYCPGARLSGLSCVAVFRIATVFTLRRSRLSGCQIENRKRRYSLGSLKADGGQSRIRTGCLSLCLRLCFQKHLPPMFPATGRGFLYPNRLRFQI